MHRKVIAKNNVVTKFKMDFGNTYLEWTAQQHMVALASEHKGRQREKKWHIKLYLGVSYFGVA